MVSINRILILEKWNYMSKIWDHSQRWSSSHEDRNNYLLPEPGRPTQESFRLNIDKWGRKNVINVRQWLANEQSTKKEKMNGLDDITYHHKMTSWGYLVAPLATCPGTYLHNHIFILLWGFSGLVKIHETLVRKNVAWLIKDQLLLISLWDILGRGLLFSTTGQFYSNIIKHFLRLYKQWNALS